MVMAVPMAAVARLVLANVDHPMTRGLAEVLAGRSGPQLPAPHTRLPSRIPSPRRGTLTDTIFEGAGRGRTQTDPGGAGSKGAPACSVLM